MTCDTWRMTSERPLSARSRAGRWLREQRLRRGYRTAAELGRAIGASKEVIWSYESGRSAVPDDRAERIAEALGMDIITVRRNLGLWVPPDAGAPESASEPDEIEIPSDREEQIKLARQLIARANELNEQAHRLLEGRADTG